MNLKQIIVSTLVAGTLLGGINQASAEQAKPVTYNNRAQVVQALEGGKTDFSYDTFDLPNLNSFKKMNGVGLDLNDLDFSGKRFTNADFSRVGFQNCDFSDADLSGASFYGTTLKNVNFTNAELIGVDFSFSYFNKTNLNKVDIYNANFFHTYMEDIDLKNTFNVGYATFRGVKYLSQKNYDHIIQERAKTNSNIRSK